MPPGGSWPRGAAQRGRSPTEESTLPDRTLTAEPARKLIHLATVLAPLAVWVLPRPASVALLGTAVLLALLVEWGRRHNRWARYHFLRGTRRLLRTHERSGLAGATYMAIGYFFAAVLFPRPVAVTAMLFNALGDSGAALVGRRWGRHRTRWGKSWEGMAAGFCVDLAVALTIPGISSGAALVGAGAAAFIEFIPMRIDDNLRITLGGGAALLLAVHLLA